MTTAELRDRLTRAAALAAAGSSDFDLNPGQGLPAGTRLKPAAVLVGVQPGPMGARLWLTKRSSRLKHHPGQIALPGGKIDPGDDGPIAAALREAEEEIALPQGLVEVLGTLPPHQTVTAYSVTPVLGLIGDDFQPTPEEGEVEEIFTVPFAHVANPARFCVQSRAWRGQRRHYFTVPYGPYYIWGATARILRGLAERLQ